MMSWKIATAAGCLCAIGAVVGAMMGAPSSAQAAEINVIASTAMREVLEELGPMFERASGNKVTVTMKANDKERTTAITIVKISDTEMSVESDDGKKSESR